MAAAAIGASDVTKIGIGATAALVVIGILLAVLITAFLARLIIAILVVAVAVIVWQQRASIEHRIDQQICPAQLSFFGMHVDAPQSLQHFCRAHRAG
jgi:hypothetical protein